MKSIRVMYVATNEYYYALRSMDSEHLRAAFRAGVPRQLEAHNFYILTETVKRRINPLVGVRVEDIQISGATLAVQLRITTATPSRVYAQHAGGNNYLFSFPVGEKVPDSIQRAFAKQIHAETQDDLISSVHDIVRSLPGVHIKSSSLRSARSTKLSNLETFDIFVEG
nr:MAG TPA: hypothetical protein [Caudoviricetes sp.]